MGKNGVRWTEEKNAEIMEAYLECIAIRTFIIRSIAFLQSSSLLEGRNQKHFPSGRDFSQKSHLVMYISPSVTKKSFWYFAKESLDLGNTSVQVLDTRGQ